MTCSSALPLPCQAFFPTNPSVTQKSRPLQGRRRSHKSRLQTYAQKASQRRRSGRTCWMFMGKILKCSICFGLITVFCTFWQQKRGGRVPVLLCPVCLSFCKMLPQNAASSFGCRKKIINHLSCCILSNPSFVNQCGFVAFS